MRGYKKAIERYFEIWTKAIIEERILSHKNMPCFW